MDKAFKDIYDLHAALGAYTGLDGPKIPDIDTQRLRWSLIDEEIRELHSAIVDDDLPKIADGIVDSIVVLIGTALAYGIDLRPLWDEVQRANMAKVGGPKRADGKCLKPPGWQPPNIEGLLVSQLPLRSTMSEQQKAVTLVAPLSACYRCGGSGRRVYPTTSTWHGTVGGAAPTEDVCDACWGSGNVNRKGPDLRVLVRALDDIQRVVSIWTKEAQEQRVANCPAYFAKKIIELAGKPEVFGGKDESRRRQNDSC